MTDWTRDSIQALFDLPLLEVVFRAQTVHRNHFPPDEVELCTLLNIKTGACPENCAYCPQSGHYDTGLQKESLLSVDDIVEKAKNAKAHGATRFCMAAAWRQPPQKDMPKLVEIVKAVKALGLSTCLTAGMLSDEQVAELNAAELNYYNHNLDTSPEYYDNIITTHTYEDRLQTLARVGATNIRVCCGGIMGLGEDASDRIGLLLQLAQLKTVPESIPINKLIRVKGTPLEHQDVIDNFDFIRVIAVTRIMFPTAMVRLSGGRLEMPEEMQAFCFMAGANSIHFGEKLLVTPNPDRQKDLGLLHKLGLKPRVNPSPVPC